MKYLKFTGVVLFAFVLSSCVLTSINPLGDKKDAVLDKRLIGMWAQKENPNPGEVLYVYRGGGRSFKFIADSSEYLGYVTEIDGDRYLNLQEVRDVDDERRVSEEYMLAYYTISKNNELLIALFDEDAFQKAIDAGELKGEVVKGEWSKRVTLTDTTTSLAGFIRKNKDKKFLGDPAVFVKSSRWERFIMVWLPGNWIPVTVGLMILILGIVAVVVTVKTTWRFMRGT